MSSPTLLTNRTSRTQQIDGRLEDSTTIKQDRFSHKICAMADDIQRVLARLEAVAGRLYDGKVPPAGQGSKVVGSLEAVVQRLEAATAVLEGKAGIHPAAAASPADHPTSTRRVLPCYHSVLSLRRVISPLFCA